LTKWAIFGILFFYRIFITARQRGNEHMKHLVDTIEGFCLEDYEKQGQTPLWKVEINGRSFRDVQSPGPDEKKSSEPTKALLAATPCTTLH
jgi:hypothetical protein